MTISGVNVIYDVLFINILTPFTYYNRGSYPFGIFRKSCDKFQPTRTPPKLAFQLGLRKTPLPPPCDWEKFQTFSENLKWATPQRALYKIHLIYLVVSVSMENKIQRPFSFSLYSLLFSRQSIFHPTLNLQNPSPCPRTSPYPFAVSKNFLSGQNPPENFAHGICTLWHKVCSSNSQIGI